MFDLSTLSGVAAVLEIEDEADAVPVCNALLEGGVRVIELALRTKAAEPSIARITAEVSGMTVGAGTLIARGQAARVKALGAAFALSPGFNPAIVHEADEAGLPFVPGVATPSEIEAAIETGRRILKFFPAEPLGGLSYLQSVNSPYAYLGLSYIPLGGLTVDNLRVWAASPLIAAAGGTWIAPRPLIKAHDWKEIKNRAAAAVRLWQEVRGSE